MLLYHATDESCAASILAEGFKPRQNDEHWLGNGAYFYLDFDLAKWWTTNPTKKFGVSIHNPCILRVDLDVPPEKLLDLSTLSGYLDCLNAYVILERIALRRLKTNVFVSRKKLRCAIFDAVFANTEWATIIGAFTHKKQEYLKAIPTKSIGKIRSFDLPFVEKQVCVRPDLIKPNMITHCGNGGAADDTMER